MTAVRRSIPLLQFSAGSLRLGIAAEDVLSVTPEVDESDPHIANLFGVPPAGGERRTIRLPTSGEQRQITARCSFQADLPLQVVTCEGEQILPMPAGVREEMWRPVIGFARISKGVILLLDIPSLVAKLLEQYGRQ